MTWITEKELERETKNKQRPISLEEKLENFIAVVRKWKMLAATKVRMSGSEKKVNRNTYNISCIKRLTRKFQEVSRYSRAEQRKEMYIKSVLRVQSCFFAN